MAKISYPTTSPYALTPQTSWSMGLYVHRPIPASVDDEPYTIDVKYHHRPDKLAADLYGDAKLYWVFMVRNMNIIRDPLWGFEAGLEIYLPSRERLAQLRI